MKKTFPLQQPGQADARVLEAIKQDVRRYVKRERRKPRSTGVDFWDFDCRVGVNQAPPTPKHLAEVIPAIEAAAKAEGTLSVFVEILAKPGHRTKKPVAAAVDGGGAATEPPVGDA
jgi:Family of unknown function (DUF6172)